MEMKMREASFNETLAVDDERFDEILASLASEHGRGLIPAGHLRIGMLVKEGKKKAFKVREIEPCGSQWRSHIHVNKSMCYWRHTKVRVV